jgi:hypothetical protein
MPAPMESLYEEAFSTLWNYSTALVMALEKDSVPSGTPPYADGGSGTFVRVRDYPCLLTAGHVWYKGLQHVGRVCFAIGDGRPTVWVDRDRLKVLHCSPRLTRTEEQKQGPDIALIGLPEDTFRALDAMGKSFYNVESSAARSAARVGF